MARECRFASWAGLDLGSLFENMSAFLEVWEVGDLNRKKGFCCHHLLLLL